MTSLRSSVTVQPETTITVYDYIKQNLTAQKQNQYFALAAQQIAKEGAGCFHAACAAEIFKAVHSYELVAGADQFFGAAQNFVKTAACLRQFSCFERDHSFAH